LLVLPGRAQQGDTGPDLSLPGAWQGWNKKYDEWVEAPGLTKFDPTLLGMSLDTVGAAAGAGPGSRGMAAPGGGAAPSPRGAFGGAEAHAVSDPADDGAQARGPGLAGPASMGAA
jgi:mortality factor 4-like protein 1